MNKSNIGTIGTLIGLYVATTFVLQDRSLSRLRQENRELHEESEHLGKFGEDNKILSAQLAQGRQSQRLPFEQFLELMRLRDEIGSLRIRLNKSTMYDVKGYPEGLQWSTTDTRTGLDIIRDGDRITVSPNKPTR